MLNTLVGGIGVVVFLALLFICLEWRNRRHYAADQCVCAIVHERVHPTTLVYREELLAKVEAGDGKACRLIYRIWLPALSGRACRFGGGNPELKRRFDDIWPELERLAPVRGWIQASTEL